MNGLDNTAISDHGLKSIQFSFTHYIRSGEDADCPNGLDARRMAVYRDLFYKNIASFCSGVYPVLMSIVTKPIFMQMVRQFMQDYRAKTPYFHQIGEEFYAWLEQQNQFELPPFGLELAHYEWLELAVDVMDVENPSCDPNGNCWTGAPVLSAAIACPSYHFAVHKINTGFTDPDLLRVPTFLAVWRNRQDKVKFMEMNAVTWSLLTYLLEQQSEASDLLTGEAVAEQVWISIGSGLGVDHSTFMKGAMQTFEHLKENGVVLGTSIH